MSFHTRQRADPVKLQTKFDNVNIAYKEETKFVEHFIIKNMKWDANVKLLSTKFSKFNHKIQCLEYVMRQNVIRGIYYAYFTAHLMYNLIYWGGGFGSDSILSLKISYMNNQWCREIYVI